MNKILSLLIFAFTAICLPAQINFKSATIEKVKTEVVSDGVSGFVYVHGDWCVSCQVMEETTFKSEPVLNALSGKYNPYKVDFDSKEGKKWATEYEICCLPTMLFFDKKGNQIQKIQAPLTSTTLSSILKNPGSYNSKNQVAKVPAYETTEYSDGTIIMEEVSFSDENPKTTSKVDTEDSSKTLVATPPHSKEIIEYSEQKNNATSEQKRGEFLYHLSNHIESLENRYIEYAISETTQISDLISNVKTPAIGENAPISSTLKLENGQLIEDTETLYELIQELKDWEYRLKNPDYDIRPILITNDKKDLTPIDEAPIEKETITASNTFRIQMGYFKNEKFATRMVKDLNDAYNYSIELKTEEQSEGTFYRVLLGNFKSEKEASQVYKRMKKEGRKALLKKD